MYGCYDGIVVYGFNEINRESLLDENWLRENYPDLEFFCADIVRNHLGTAVYGVRCSISEETGIPEITEEEKEKVKVLYARFQNSYGKEEDREKSKGKRSAHYLEENSRLGFHVCVSSPDVETSQHEKYKLNETNERIVVTAAKVGDRFKDMGMLMSMMGAGGLGRF